ncbi:15652_t:CDS:1, partial [Dentiscutata erythropus]
TTIFVDLRDSFNQLQQYINLVEGVEGIALFTRTQGAENQIPRDNQLLSLLILGLSFP